ncbi:MAG: DUF4350 domain-containing protein [Bdellovibrionales bacterium]|nr:DUF4350 domain-containing protein [Bdellovibrionales bacterium]
MFPFSIQVLVNYWEIRQAILSERINSLCRNGVSHLCSFLPWQAVESDISHSLTRFLQACAQKKLNVTLILSPEVGVHYANSGFPKDLFNKVDLLARSQKSETMQSPLPPNVFSLPSLLHPEFQKRYHNYLTRMDSYFADVDRLHPGVLDRVRVVLTGSLWKYYRLPKLSALHSFEGSSGDYSPAAISTFRQKLDAHYSQREFGEAGVASNQRWKTRAMEETNRRWFFQSAEDQFRFRSAQFLKKRSVSLKVSQVELYTPEADPAFAYSNFLQLVSGASGDFQRLSSFLDEAAMRGSSVASGSQGAVAPNFVHWTGLGGFRTLSDSEKQFLILKSLLLMGSQKGGVIIDEEEWFGLSHSFRNRVEILAAAVSAGEFELQNRAFYLVPHLWSNPDPLWNQVYTRVGHQARLVASIDRVLADPDARLLFVDPSYGFTQTQIAQLLEWARSGRMLVIPKSRLYSDAAENLVKDAIEESAGRNSMEIDLGVPFHLHQVGPGKGRLVVYDGSKSKEDSSHFISSILSVAGVQNICALSDIRLRTIPLSRPGSAAAVFVMNSTSRPVGADLFFSAPVSVSDLALEMRQGKRAVGGNPIQQGLAALAEDIAHRNPIRVNTEASPKRGQRFSLDVPSCGIMPISVDGLDLKSFEESAQESLAAALVSQGEKPGDVASRSAHSELPGFSDSVSFGSVADGSATEEKIKEDHGRPEL